MSARPDQSRTAAPSATTSPVEIYCDGACSGNPGPGGYGAILRYNGHEKEIRGSEAHTTNNRMELTAAMEALRLLTRPCRITIVTDSQYLVKGMTEWIQGWQRRGWQNSKKEPVLNRDLWEELLKLSAHHDVSWQWIRGHAGHAENERCDSLARQAITEMRGAP
ncbi:ribonuclease HI [Pelobacter propionicus]|uniref:Ribonuclease H n=1 Tax=Pelobacter propionicus (strain DSM 2379 / NBRC 103807 / OttBd1) TaxID=338966 RepID=RNH_PELPD|nr:ribonuclease HI [Pelobacter propionicus]A1AT66.1 RecName: Full=Ribonuclease H; Short=RNase H [Pelobacter propionicus DSM 2379]ABL00537.1 ribonuclease H [Pelobacter propionicus DSM 2379]